MAQERSNQYPYPRASDALNAPGDRAVKAARNVVSRYVAGIPKRAYILGENDGAPVVLGVADLCYAAYTLLDLLDPVFAEGTEESGALDAVRAVLESHGCPPDG